MAADANASRPEDRSAKRELERKSRLRRAANLTRMRQTYVALERTALVMRTLEEPVWERFYGADAIRMRGVLQLVNETRKLEIEQAELRRLLHEHQLSADAMKEMLRMQNRDDWARNVARWREQATKHFQPWCLAAFQEERERALKELNAFKWRIDHQTSGLSFFGWQEVRRVDHTHNVFEFEFYKTFRGYDIMDYVNVMWDTFSNDETFQEVVVARRFPSNYSMLQQLGPNAMITRVTHKIPGLEGYCHVVFLVFRVKTETGFTQCVRSICCPELMRAFGGENDVWPSDFIWFRWDHLEDGKKGYQFRLGGRMGLDDINYANQWMLEMFGCVLRGERVATRRELICGDLPHSLS